MEQPYLAVLSLRHPNISASFRAFAFHITAAVNPAIAEAAAAAAAAAAQQAASGTAAGSTTLSAAALLQSLGPIFNPQLNPTISLLAQFPSINVQQYGGAAKVVSDFSAIVASTAALDGPDWVVATMVNSTPATINATVSDLARGTAGLEV